MLHSTPPSATFFFFFFNDTSTTDIYTLSLHDALPILSPELRGDVAVLGRFEAVDGQWLRRRRPRTVRARRAEEHTSELQSRQYLVCRLLLEKKKAKKNSTGKSP